MGWVPEMPTGLTLGSDCAVCKPARRYFQWRRRFSAGTCLRGQIERGTKYLTQAQK